MGLARMMDLSTELQIACQSIYINSRARMHRHMYTPHRHNTQRKKKLIRTCQKSLALLYRRAYVAPRLEQSYTGTCLCMNRCVRICVRVACGFAAAISLAEGLLIPVCFSSGLRNSWELTIEIGESGQSTTGFVTPCQTFLASANNEAASPSIGLSDLRDEGGEGEGLGDGRPWSCKLPSCSCLDLAIILTTS